MTDIVQPVPITLLPVPPQPTDTPEEFDAKSFATLDAQVVMVPQVNAAADATWKNAKAGEERAFDANQAKNAAEIARGQAQTAANSAGASAAVVSRWDKLVLGPKNYFPTVDDDGQALRVGAEFYHTTLKARYSWNGTAWAVGTNVTAGVASVDGMAGTVVLDKGAFVYSRANKIPNASFARGLDGWGMYSDTNRWDWVLQDVAQGLKAAMLINVQGTVALSVSQLPVVGGRQYEWTAETFFSGATGGVTRLYVEWFDAGNAYISSSYGAALGVANYPADYANRQANLTKATAPANAVYARLAFWAGTLTGPANVGIHRPKFQESTPGTNSPMLFTDEATIALLGQVSGARGQQTFTSSQTINKSIFGLATYVEVEMWGGGASGGAAVTTGAGSGDRAGGEGGEFVRFVVRVADLPNSISLVVGAGGAAVTATASGTGVFLNGNPGGATSFNGVSAPGGSVDATGTGYFGAAKTWLCGKNGGDGGGEGAASGIGIRIKTGPGGSSMYGGAGGGGSLNSITQPGGTSTFGGNGGAGKLTTSNNDSAGAATTPGGGGGGIRYSSNTGTATSSAGQRGEIRLRWW